MIASHEDKARSTFLSDLLFLRAITLPKLANWPTRLIEMKAISELHDLFHQSDPFKSDICRCVNNINRT